MTHTSGFSGNRLSSAPLLRGEVKCTAESNFEKTTRTFSHTHLEMASQEDIASGRWVHRWLTFITLLVCFSAQASAQMVRPRPLVNRLVALARRRIFTTPPLAERV